MDMGAAEIRAFWGALADESGALVHFGVGADRVQLRAAGRPVYVATPFTRPVAAMPKGVNRHIEALHQQKLAAKALDALAQNFVSGISPVVQSVAMLETRWQVWGDESAPRGVLDHGFWMAWALRYLDGCRSIWVPDIAGWSESAGVHAEVREALLRNLPVMIEAPLVPGGGRGGRG